MILHSISSKNTGETMAQRAFAHFRLRMLGGDRMFAATRKKYRMTSVAFDNQAGTSPAEHGCLKPSGWIFTPEQCSARKRNDFRNKTMACNKVSMENHTRAMPREKEK
jgi:hypothetical protein